MIDPTAVQLIDRLLSVIETEILPLTSAGVAVGNKIFGAALLHKADLSTLLAETNNELESPLLHGEMHALKRYFELPADQRPAPKDLIFLASHEPCSLCLSAITWSGFDNFYYFFTHEDSRDAFAIPHDLKILKEVFNIDPGGYRRSNAFWNSFAIRELVANLPADEALACKDRSTAIMSRYENLSTQYQSGKTANAIPLK